MTQILALEDPIFQPAMRVVTAITRADPAEVTTSFAHDYITGAIVRLIIPVDFGMQQMNQKKGTITVTGDTTFTIDIDSTRFDLFAVPVDNEQYAQVLPVGEINSVFTSAVRNTL